MYKVLKDGKDTGTHSSSLWNLVDFLRAVPRNGVYKIVDDDNITLVIAGQGKKNWEVRYRNREILNKVTEDKI